MIEILDECILEQWSQFLGLLKNVQNVDRENYPLKNLIPLIFYLQIFIVGIPGFF